MVLTTTLGGAIQTPMRAELCGTIAALAAETDGHLAADNAGAVKGVKRATYAIKKKRSVPYYKRPNADLWRMIWPLLLKHGEEAVKIRWTRAHATQQHIQQGTTTHGGEEGGLFASHCLRSASAARVILNGKSHTRFL